MVCYRQTENKCSDHDIGNDADVRGLAYIISDGKAVGIEDESSLPLVTPTGSVCLRQSGSPCVSDYLWFAAE